MWVGGSSWSCFPFFSKLGVVFYFLRWDGWVGVSAIPIWGAYMEFFFSVDRYQRCVAVLGPPEPLVDLPWAWPQKESILFQPPNFQGRAVRVIFVLRECNSSKNFVFFPFYLGTPQKLTVLDSKWWRWTVEGKIHLRESNMPAIFSVIFSMWKRADSRRKRSKVRWTLKLSVGGGFKDSSSHPQTLGKWFSLMKIFQMAWNEYVSSFFSTHLNSQMWLDVYYDVFPRKIVHKFDLAILPR